jgi:hypothetical protein
VESRPDPGPLAQSLARLDEDVDWGTFRLLPRAPGSTPRPPWLRCADLLADPAQFTVWRAHIAAALARELGVARDAIAAVVPAAYQLTWYADVIGWAAGALFHRERRVPSCAPRDLWFGLDESGYPARIGLTEPRFACLPTDPDAGHRDARVLADEHSLAALLRSHVAGHAEQFLLAWQPEVRLGPRTRWGAISDILDIAPWSAGMARGREAAGVASSAVVMAGAAAPLLPGTRIYLGRDEHGRPFYSRHRHACCFAFRLPGHEACFSCPRVTDEERRARASQWPDTGPPAG